MSATSSSGRGATDSSTSSTGTSSWWSDGGSGLPGTVPPSIGLWMTVGRAGPGGTLGTMRIEAVPGNITTQRVDAVVNAANSSLLGGGGVDGAIHAAAGPELLAECRRLRSTTWPDGLPVGEATVTGAGRMPARWVVHTVGPDAHRGQTDPALLASCFTCSLDEAAAVGARTVAVPAVSAGVYGWQAAAVAEVAVGAVRRWAAADPDGLDLVRFVLLSPAVLAEFRCALES